MNPQYNDSPGLHLPQPASIAGNPQNNPGHSQGYSTPPSNLPAQSQVNELPVVAQQPVLSSDPVVSPTFSTTAETDDLLDEEWVAKAKELASRYQSDPFMQAKELGRAKAQYLRIRYNKEIKVSED